MHIRNSDLKSFDRVKRLNIVNSLSGIKAASLIGTQNTEGVHNLAIFNSVIHLSSNPPLMGMMARPKGDISGQTFENIKAVGYFTINHTPTDMIENAHYTSAKFESSISEFEECAFEAEHLDAFQAPYAKQSRLKIGLKYRESVHIEASNTTLIIGEVQHIYLEDNALTPEGYINFEALHSAGVTGLNSYYELKKMKDFPYARTNELPNFK